jgi:hypothetical protein
MVDGSVPSGNNFESLEDAAVKWHISHWECLFIARDSCGERSWVLQEDKTTNKAMEKRSFNIKDLNAVLMTDRKLLFSI